MEPLVRFRLLAKQLQPNSFTQFIQILITIDKNCQNEMIDMVWNKLFRVYKIRSLNHRNVSLLNRVLIDLLQSQSQQEENDSKEKDIFEMVPDEIIGDYI